ncbi:MAG: DUF488 domain-containing protein [Clostridiaceae bacterium]
MELYTIGFTQKSAEQFFEVLKRIEVDLLIDIRLNNKSQLAGFTKGDDLKYFLREICHCQYIHAVEFAPTDELLTRYRNKLLPWDEYEVEYKQIIRQIDAYALFVNMTKDYSKVCLLCSEPKPTQCHRRLLSDFLADSNPEIKVKHL